MNLRYTWIFLRHQRRIELSFNPSWEWVCFRAEYERFGIEDRLGREEQVEVFECLGDKERLHLVLEFESLDIHDIRKPACNPSILLQAIDDLESQVLNTLLKRELTNEERIVTG
jgi:hypothetical protein